MHIEDSPLERTPDLVAKIRALREQAEKEMDRFTDARNYVVRHVIGKKPKPAPDVAPSNTVKKKQVKKAEQASIDFSFSPSPDPTDGEEV